MDGGRGSSTFARRLPLAAADNDMADAARSNVTGGACDLDPRKSPPQLGLKRSRSGDDDASRDRHHQISRISTIMPQQHHRAPANDPDFVSAQQAARSGTLPLSVVRPWIVAETEKRARLV